MAKIAKQFIALVGFDVPEGRFEKDQIFDASEISNSTLDVLFDCKDIAVYGEEEEVVDGDR